MVEVKEVNPNDLEIDPLNERKERIGPQDIEQNLVESIRQQGVIQPPIVRNQDGVYKVIVGQRRTLAAQTAGVDTIPVVIADWDDSEAVSATITENVDAFKNSVSRTDRAAAIKKLMELNDWNIREVADHLGVHNSVVSEWLERTKPEWEGTDVHVEEAEDSSDEKRQSVDKVDDKTLGVIRRATGGGEKGQEIVEKVSKNDLSQAEVIEAEKRSRRGEDFDEVLNEKIQEKNSKPEGEIKANVNITFTGDYAMALQQAAKDRGTSEQQVVKGAIEQYLESEGYL